jgi:acid phosphatase family membrane protein YuiD
MDLVSFLATGMAKEVGMEVEDETMVEVVEVFTMVDARRLSSFDTM